MKKKTKRKISKSFKVVAKILFYIILHVGYLTFAYYNFDVEQPILWAIICYLGGVFLCFFASLINRRKKQKNNKKS